ncbi:MAG: hypothetical protein ACF8QF_00910 [Phycisphaerales bacterium]
MPKTLRTIIRAALATAVVCAALLAPAHAFAADKIFLKDGRVLEGDLGREGDTFIFITIEVGGVKQQQLILKETIDRIERDVDAPDGPAKADPKNDPEQQKRLIDSGATKIAFITLGDPPHDMVGPYMNAGALRESVKLLEDDNPDIVVLWVNSGGGALSEIPRLRDVIVRDIKPNYRTVVWVESAISAAAMTSITVEEIYFMSKGNFGAAVAFVSDGSTAQSMQGDQLEGVLRFGEELSREGNHDPLIMRAMQTEVDLSCDIDEYGRVTWRDDLRGQHIVSSGGRILTFNALDAKKYGLSRGIADTKEDLALLLQAGEWVEVGQDAEAEMQKFRDNVARAEVEIGEAFQKMQIALQAGETGRARRYLGELRSWARRAPSWTVYNAGGVPPLNDQFFREMERQIDQVRRGGR